MEMKARKPEDGGGIPVGVFVTVVKSLEGLMAQVAKRQMGKKGGGIKFHISEISRAGPVAVGIAPLGKDSDAAEQIVTGTEETLRLVAKKKTADIPAPEYKAIRRIVIPVARGKLRSATIQRANGAAVNAAPVCVDEKYAEIFMRGYEGELRDLTTVTGMVEGVDLRSTPVQLKVYPPIGGPFTLRISGDAQKIAKKAIGKRVSASGTAFYRRDFENFYRPYRVDADVSQVEVFDPNNRSGPRLRDFRGAFPDLTDGKDTVEYLREMRGDND